MFRVILGLGLRLRLWLGLRLRKRSWETLPKTLTITHYPNQSVENKIGFMDLDWLYECVSSVVFELT